MEGLRYTFGTIAGRHHVGKGNLLTGENNQDALKVWTMDHVGLVSVICDGCSSSKYSELGARLGSQIFVTEIADALKAGRLSSLENADQCLLILESIRLAALTRLDAIVWQAVGRGASKVDHDKFIQDHLLFTTMVAIVTPSITIVASIGDGLFAINGEINRIGPFANNAPPYLSYALMEPGSYTIEPQLLSFQLGQMIATNALASLLLGSDGAVDLWEQASRNIPGKTRLIGPLSDLWSSDDLFPDGDTHDLLTLWLRQVNSEVVRMAGGQDGERVLERHYGRLPDDTTLFVVRRWEKRNA